MKAWILAGAIAALALVGCQKKEEATWPGIFNGQGSRGRYVAVGMYSPGALWTQLKPAAAPKPASGGSEASATDPAAASLDDDDEVIVVMDSATGELRQCGNFSGHCIGFNPWVRPLDSTQSAPVPLLKHARQLQAEANAAAEKERQEFELKILKK